ncbi:ESPR-type extended signal peptide-containing protein, partial [Histophilus somni]
MNKIFKTKYDITTGQCKAVSELASNRQIASSSESKPKCGVFFGVFGAFKLAPLALALSVVLPVEVLGQGFSPGVTGLQDGEAKDVQNMMKTGIKGEGFIDVDVGSFTCSKQGNGAGGGFGASNNQGIHNCSSNPIKIKLKDDITQKITKATELSDLFSRGGQELAPSSAEVNVGSDSIRIRWKDAGAGENKNVINVGSGSTETLLKHVAAGKVQNGSTDAVNGGQLYSVIEAFGKLGSEVLGAQVWLDGESDGGKRFGKSTFRPVQSNGYTRKSQTTFREAIQDTIEAINQGMTFKVGGNGSGSSNNNTIKRQLGQSLTFKGDDYLTLSTEGSSGKDTIKLAVNATDSINSTSGGNSNGNDKKLTTVKAVRDYVNSKITSGGGSGGSSTGTQSLHYLSVNDGTNGAGSGSSGSSGTKGNYNNDGAKMEGAIAIGVGAEATEKYAIALGYEAKSKAEQAIVIGKDLNVDVKHSVLLGSGITVTQGSKEKQDAVVAVGNGVTFNNAKGSIAISAVNEGDGSDHTKLDNAEWSLAIGNKTKINSGTDIVALGNNINVNKANGGDEKSANSGLVIIGNKANAENAKYSVVIGQDAKSQAQSAVVLGKGANVQASATGAVAIGEGASVSTAAGDSIALGRNSKATTRKLAPTGLTSTTGANDITISWSSAGAGANKSVLSIGDSGKERIITNVAAGTVQSGSTDAINGGQLYSVIDVFANLGINVLGAEKADTGTDGFKKTTFKAVSYNGNETNARKSTFREAIEDTITAINKGLKFAGDTGGEQSLKLGDTLNIKGKEDSSNGNHKNITTTSSGSNLTIALSDTLKGINSVGKDNNNILSFSNGSNSTSTATLKVGGTDLTFTQTGTNGNSKVKISGVADGSDQNDAVNFKQLEAAKLHYISVRNDTAASGTTSNRNDNFDNDGAKAQNSIAIGHSAKVENGNSHDSVAIGYQSNVTNAKWSTAVGAETQVKSIQSLALGYQAKVLENSDASIAIGVSGETKIINSKWSTALGNKIAITGSDNNILALGSNISVGTNNANLIIIGNGENGGSNGTITNAKNSVIIGKHAISQAESAVVIGKDATVQASAIGAVAIGEGASVSTNAGDSIALGKGSKAEDKKQAFKTQELSVNGSYSLLFKWENAGTSASDSDKKSVLSIGDMGRERVIRHVAAGEIRDGSTDAINGGQLKGVIDVFGYLGTDVLGAEKAETNKAGFKQTTFTKLKDKNGAETNPASTTFKDAITKNIEKINEGLKFKVENGTSAGGSAGNSTEMTRQLGATVTFKGGKHLKATIDSSKGEISFEAESTDTINDTQQNSGGSSGSSSNKLVTETAVKTYITQKLQNVGGTLQLEGDNTQNGSTPANPVGKVELNKHKLKITGESDFIKTEVTQDKPTVTIKLADQVKKKLEVITVNGNGDNSFALGKGSEIVKKKTAPSGTTQNTGQSEVTISWKNAGASADTMEGNKKEVVSVGSTGSERIITHVAAGEVRDGSTDAINGGQLYNVIQVFGKLGTEVLGAEKNDRGDGFKKTTFTALKDTSGGNQATKDTFKDAINANISKINEGLKFAVETGGGAQSSMASGNGPLTRQLGSTLTFGGDSYLTPSLDNSGGKITFKLKVATSISDTNSGSTTDQNDNKLVTASAVKEYLKNQLNSLTLKIEADNSNTAQAQAGGQAQSAAPSTPSSSGQSQSSNGKVQGAVKIQSQALQVLGTTDEIETKVEDKQQKVTIKLADQVKKKLDVITVNGKDGDNSFALGDGSQIVNKKTAPSGTIQNVGGNDIKISWSAGVGANKEVISVGKKDAERIITYVAAGEVKDTSTDAVNGGQLYNVIQVFGKLGTDVLGAEKDDSGDGFKKTTFTALNKEDGTKNKATTTFKEAIDESIKTINKGLIFEVDDGTTTTATTTAPQTGGTSTNKMTRQLGATIKFKGDDYIKPSIDADTGTISFKIEATEEIKENGSADGSSGNSSAEDKKLTTAKAVKDFVNSKIKTITDQQTEADKIAVKYDDEHKKSITLGGKPQNGGKAHDPVAIKNLKSA